jgi:hypothetical protein
VVLTFTEIDVGPIQTIKCPRCLVEPETAVHVYRCQLEDARTCWNTGVDKTKQWLESAQTNRIVIDGSIENLRRWQWQVGQETKISEVAAPEITQAFILQDALGWTAFVESRMSPEWEAVQSSYQKSYCCEVRTNAGWWN